MKCFPVAYLLLDLAIQLTTSTYHELGLEPENIMSLLYIFLGLLAGILSGLIGIGGGVIIVPSLIFLFGFSQLEAQGTTLGLLVPPIGILAAWTYYQQGYVNLKVAALICLGFILGGLLGAKIALVLPSKVLERVFGIALLSIALKIIFS